MMWSRIVTANMRSRPAVGDRVAERGQAPLGEPGHHARQLLEARLARDERVEGRVAQELQREREPVLRRAPPGTRRREGPDLARPDPQPARVERAAERERDRGVAVPA